MSDANNDVKVNRKFKDTLFRKLFGESKENAIDLYNAINGTDYTTSDGFEFTTLDDVIYMKMKNDVSFLLGTTMNLYEHQSTYNPNMPIRGLMYFSDLYRKLIKDGENLYGKKLIKIPNPKYIVFYNGDNSDLREERKVLKLSDAFENKDTSGEYEWTATMININHGHNIELMNKCRVLYEYSMFIEKIKRYCLNFSLKDAVNKAVEEAIHEGILADFLEQHRKEVLNMCLTEFDEVKFANYIREEGREEGLAEGRIVGLAEGRKEGREEGQNLLASLMTKLFAANRSADAELAAKDEEARKRFYREFGIID